MATKKLTKFFILLIALIMCISTFVACSKNDSTKTKYLEAFQKIEEHDYEKAYALFTGLGDYKDSKKELAKFRYIPTKHTFEIADFNGTNNENIIVTLNQNNLPLQCITTYEDGFTHTCNYTYNPSGKVTSISCEYSDGYQEEIEYVYDQNNNLILETTIFDDITTFYKYYYNEKGLETKKIIMDSNGFYALHKKSYDSNNNEIKIDLIINEESYTINSTYTEDNKILKRVKLDENNNQVGLEEFFYDQNGNLIKTNFAENNLLSLSIEYTYNEKNQLVSKNIKESSDRFSTYSYTYDDNGNIVKTQRTTNDSYEEVCESDFKLVYVPFEYSDTEWKTIVENTIYM